MTAGGPVRRGCRQLQTLAKPGKVQVVSFDFVDETMRCVKDGVIYGTIGQDPFAQGHDPAIRLYNYLVGGVVPRYGRLLTRADVVTKDNITQFWTPPAGMAARRHEVSMTLPDDRGLRSARPMTRARSSRWIKQPDQADEDRGAGVWRTTRSGSRSKKAH